VISCEPCHHSIAYISVIICQIELNLSIVAISMCFFLIQSQNEDILKIEFFDITLLNSIFVTLLSALAHGMVFQYAIANDYKFHYAFHIQFHVIMPLVLYVNLALPTSQLLLILHENRNLLNQYSSFRTYYQFCTRHDIIAYLFITIEITTARN